MPAIPEFLLRKLYVPDSLKLFEGGFTFELNNTFAPVTLTGLGLNVDSQPYSPGEIFLSLPGLGEILAGGISGESPFSLPVNTSLTVRVYGAPPQKRMVIRADTLEAGVLQFGVGIETSEPEPVKKQPGFFSKTQKRLAYAGQVFRVQQDPQHPSYHFSPISNWMNDPNGLTYWKGNYHLFFQYNPAAPVWGNIHWGHASSKDLLHWKHLPIALAPDPQGADAGGCYSGCVVDNKGVPTLIYTGVFPEAQCLATSKNPELLEWTKHPQPVIPRPPEGMQIEGFRDPCVWQEANEWRMVLGSGLTDVGGAVLLYRSKDLLDWQYMEVLFSGNLKSVDPFWTGTMWECPCFFPLGDKWVLIVSVYSAKGPLYVIYYTGEYRVDRFEPDGPPRLLDYGAGACFYAPQTFVERKGRRVMFGWLRESRSVEEQSKAGWSGALSLPRYLSLSEEGDLICALPEGIQALRGDHEVLTGQNQLSSSVRGNCMELLIRIPPESEKWSGVHLTCGSTPQDSVLVGYDSVNGAVVVDCRNAGGLINILPADIPGMQDLVVHAYVDGSIIETFIEGKSPISARFYMDKPQAMHVRRVGEAKVDLWKIKL